MIKISTRMLIQARLGGAKKWTLSGSIFENMRFQRVKPCRSNLRNWFLHKNLVPLLKGDVQTTFPYHQNRSESDPDISEVDERQWC
jgi:hypothetical protein